jgi:hypothetical protein
MFSNPTFKLVADVAGCCMVLSTHSLPSHQAQGLKFGYSLVAECAI